MKLLVIALLLVAPLVAQENSDFALAIKTREESASEVREKKTTPEASMAKLKAHKSASGMKVDRDTDFALAAIDVGLRLVSTDEAEAAEKFFREAEKSLSKAIKSTPDSLAAEKSQLLQHRAMLRSNFLNDRTGAKEDLDAAVVLRPEDKSLLRRRDQLAGELQLLGRTTKPKS